MATIKNRIKEICASEGITPSRLAVTIGYRPNTLTRIVTGERQPSADTMAAVCAGLKRQVGDVFYIDNDEIAKINN